MMKREISGVILLLVCLGAAGFAQYAPSRETTNYIQGFKGNVRFFSKEELAVSIINANPDDAPLSENIKHNAEFLIIVPDHGSFTLVEDDVECDIYSQNRKSEASLSPSETPSFSEWVSYKNIGIFRSWRLAQLKVMTSKPVSAVDKTSLRLKRLDFRIKFTDSGARENPASAPPDPMATDIFNAMVINPECETLYRSSHAPDVAEFDPYIQFVDRMNDALTSGPVVKMIIYRGGLYGVGGSSLENLGISLEQLPPDHIVLYRGNEQVPLFLHTKSRARFDSYDRFYFYVPPFDNKDYLSYWLCVEKDPASNPPRRVLTESAPISGSGTKEPVDVFSAGNTVRFYKKNRYNHKLPSPLINGNWYWDEIKKGVFKRFTVDINCVDKASENFKLTLRLAGAEPAKTSLCEIFWNNNMIGSSEWDGMRNHAFQKAIPTSLLKEGENELVLFFPPRSTKKQASHFYFIGFEINYQQNLANDFGPLVFKLKPTTDTQTTNIWFSQPAGSPFFLMDVNNPSNPRVLNVMQMANTRKPEYNHSARVILESENTFVLGSREKALPVGGMRLVSHQNLLNTSYYQGDYVIVSHNRFLDALEPFVAFHEKKGSQPVVIDVDDIYDCFNFGDKDHEALKRFFRRRFYFTEGPRLRYGLLVGETSDYIGPSSDVSSDIQEDLVPLYNRGKPLTSAVHSDTPYACVCGDDVLPDFGLGRFPVNTVEELRDLIMKIQNYEQDIPMGDWRNKHLFLTDDEPEFASIAEIVIEQFPPFARTLRVFQQNFPYSDLIMLWQRKTSVQARNALLDYIDKGILTLNYFGHGGPNLWSSERVFHISDIIRLNNKNKAFFLTASTCDTSWLDYPEPPVKRSLGELMFLYPQGGAIGVYGPTTGATPSDHQTLFQNFYHGVFSKELLNFSDAIIYSKILFASKRVNPRLIEQFVLLGDPAGHLNVMETQSTVNALPQYIDATRGGTTLIEGYTSIQPFWGLARVTIQPPDPENPTVILKTHVFNGEFQLEYELPPRCPAGVYQVTVYSDNPHFKVQELGKTSFNVIEPSIELILEIDVPDSGHIIENTKVNVKPSIRNLSPFILEDLQISLKQGAIAQPIAERSISLQPEQELSFELAWLAEAGAHELIWEARLTWDSEGSVIQERKIIPVISAKEANKAALNPREVQVLPDPLIKGMTPELIIPIYNIGLQPFYELRLGVYIAEKLTGPHKFVKFLKSGQRVEVAYPTEIELPASRIPFQIKIDALNQNTQEFDEVFRASKIVDVKMAADLLILPDSVTFDSENFRSGETVFINATVKNQGDVTAENFYVQAFRDKPWDDAKILKPFFPVSQGKIDKLKPGEEREVRLRWDFAQKPETLDVFVVANPNRAIFEHDYQNNAARASLQIHSHVNLKIDPDRTRFSSNIIRKNDAIDVSFFVENDSDLPAEGFDVSIEQWGVNLEPVACVEPIRVSGLAPHSEILLSANWRAQPPLNRFRITVNSTYLIQENLRHDNQADFSFDNLKPLRILKRIGEKEAYSFKEKFLSGSPRELEINPLLEIYPADFADAKGHRFDVHSRYIVAGAPVISNEPDEDRDNQWTLKNIWLASSPFENVPPISFSFPLPSEIPTTLCDVYIYTHTNREYQGYPASKLRLKIEGEDSFKTYDFSTQTFPYTTVRHYLGRYDLVDRFLDVTIDDVEEVYWTIVNHFEVIPLYSVYHSPIIEIPVNVAGSSFYMDFDADIPQSARMEFSFRKSRPGDGNNLSWDEWKPFDLSGAEAFHPIETPYIQWRAEFFPWMDNKPILKNAWIRFK